MISFIISVGSFAIGAVVFVIGAIVIYQLAVALFYGVGFLLAQPATYAVIAALWFLIYWLS
ncbi:MAG: hypothetical protein BMS9Abin31_0490 [Gammaproteobacteria bacterium]|nr:MAG: hypothetical protein BMS9Abin31_0490 [Gammaproteobacteria bacterium]